MNSLFTNSAITKAVYVDVDKDIFQPSIDISILDTTSLIEILRGIDDFPTSLPKRNASLACSGGFIHLNKCCIKCDHRCTACNREECKKKCCLTNTKCAHNCMACTTTIFECRTNKKVCCKNCNTCLNCTLKRSGSTDWQTLFKNLVTNTVAIPSVCQIQILRLALSAIAIFRNLTMHLTKEKCEDMDKGCFIDPKLITFGNSWQQLRDVIWFAVKVVLSYLQGNSFITRLELNEHIEYLRCIATSTSYHEISIYVNNIQKFMNFEGFTNLNQNMLDVSDSLSEISDKMEQKPLQIEIECKLKKKIDTDLHGKDADDIRQAFNGALTKYFGSGHDFKAILTKLKPVRLKTPNTKHIELCFKISSTKISLADYEDCTTHKSKQLWQQLKEALLSMLPKATVTLGEWKIGSIIIEVLIWKKDGSDWTNDNINRWTS